MAVEKYRFLLNDIVLNRTPEGWKEITLAIERNADLNIALLSFTSNVTFLGDGYDFLFNEYTLNYNNSVDVTIERLSDTTEDYVTEFEGRILLTEVVFNLDKHTALTAIEDRSFSSRISTRLANKAILDSEFSVNGVKIAVTPSFAMDFFRENGTYTGNLADRKVYEVKATLDFLVRFMTDDEVKGVVSSYLSDISNFNQGLLYILTPKELRLKDQDAPDVSFEQVFKNLQRTHNLSFAFEKDSNGDPVMRVEDQEFFFDTTEALEIRDIKNLELSTNSDKVFSHLEVGNEISTTGAFPTDVRFFVFKEEQYAIQGKSVFNSPLDLKNDFITDTNVFMDIIENNNDEYDDEILIVEGHFQGIEALRFPSPVFHYNEGFRNNEIINRFLNGIPNSVAKFLTAPSTTCLIGANTQALLTAPVSITSAQLLFTNESSPFFDSGSNYVSTPDINNNLSYYLVPFDDTFGFRYNINFDINFERKTVFTTPDEANDASLRIEIKAIRLTNDFNTVLQSIDETRFYLLNSDNNLEIVGQGALNTSIVNFDRTVSFNPLLGEKIIIAIVIRILNTNSLNSFTMDMLPSSDFGCLGSQGDGGVFQVIEPSDYRAQLYKFIKNVSLSDIRKILVNPFKKVIANPGSDTNEDRSTWVKSLTYNLETSEATFENIT